MRHKHYFSEINKLEKKKKTEKRNDIIQIIDNRTGYLLAHSLGLWRRMVKYVLEKIIFFPRLFYSL